MVNNIQLPETNEVILDDLESLLDYPLKWKELKKLKILITGGNGFLASFLAKSLLAASERYNLGIEVIAIVRNKHKVDRLTDWLDFKGLTVFEHDLSTELPKDFPSANWIIHASSKASPKFYGSDPMGTLMPNSFGTLNLLKKAVKDETSKFLFISSSEVYGQLGIPLTEDVFGSIDPMDIRATYAESKRMGELLTNVFSHQESIDCYVARPFHTYGPGVYLDDGRVFSDFVSNVVSNEPISLNSDGKASRPFCYITDAILAFLVILMDGKSGEAYNVSNPDGNISIIDLAHMISRLIQGRHVEVKQNLNIDEDYIPSPIVKQDPRIEKILELGWKPSITLEEGFTRMIQSYPLNNK
jgi:UDP-glucuronate decarboxylase